MNTPVRLLEIRTLGGFSLKLGDREITVEWPNDISKVLFCTLLSPLDKTITTERLCRSLWDLPASPTPKRRIAAIIDHLADIFVAETGLNPFFIIGDRFGINSRHVSVDAHEFYRATAEGFRLKSLGNRQAALVKLHEAELLYRGPYMPEMFNQVISTTREDLVEIHRMVISQTKPTAQPPRQIDRRCAAEATMNMMAA